jgi:hypothetical protein
MGKPLQHETIRFPNDFGEPHYEFSDEELRIWSAQPDKKLVKLVQQKGLTLDRLALLLGDNITRAARVYKQFCSENQRVGEGRTEHTVLTVSASVQRNLPLVRHKQAMAAAAEAARRPGFLSARDHRRPLRPVSAASLSGASAGDSRPETGAGRTPRDDDDQTWGYSTQLPAHHQQHAPAAREQYAGEAAYDAALRRQQQLQLQQQQAAAEQQHRSQVEIGGVTRAHINEDGIVPTNSAAELRRLLQLLVPSLSCSAEDLRRPQFRFVYHVVSHVVKKTGFAADCLRPFERLASRQDCVGFIQSLLDQIGKLVSECVSARVRALQCAGKSVSARVRVSASGETRRNWQQLGD